MRRSRAEARLTGPPFMVPSCRSAALKKSLIRLGTVVGFCRRQSFYDRGPRAQDFHMFGVGQHSVRKEAERKWARFSRKERYLDCVTAP